MPYGLLLAQPTEGALLYGDDMSKRFTETEKWDNAEFRSLNPHEKLSFLYILDKCNLAGFWKVDIEGMGFQTKMTDLQVEGALKGLSSSIEGPIDGWIWVRNFLKYQKNLPLNPKNMAHKCIIGFLEEQEIRFPPSKALLGAGKPLACPTGKGRGKGIGLDTGIGRGRRVEKLEDRPF